MAQKYANLSEFFRSDAPYTVAAKDGTILEVNLSAEMLAKKYPSLKEVLDRSELSAGIDARYQAISPPEQL